eukprot:15366072-Ditylum_brightwellii.AAC.5
MKANKTMVGEIHEIIKRSSGKGIKRESRGKAQFHAYGTVYGFSQSIQRTVDPDLPEMEGATVDEMQPTGVKQAKALKLNTIAMCNLTMAFTTKPLMGMIYTAIKIEWPSGLASSVVESLHIKYAPKDLVSKIELRQELNSTSLKKEDDPAKLFEKISALQNIYSTATYQIPLDEMIDTVLEKAPKEYGTVLTLEQRTIGSSLTMTNLQEALVQLH